MVYNFKRIHGDFHHIHDEEYQLIHANSEEMAIHKWLCYFWEPSWGTNVLFYVSKTSLSIDEARRGYFNMQKVVVTQEAMSSWERRMAFEYERSLTYEPKVCKKLDWSKGF